MMASSSSWGVRGPAIERACAQHATASHKFIQTRSRPAAAAGVLTKRALHPRSIIPRLSGSVLICCQQQLPGDASPSTPYCPSTAALSHGTTPPTGLGSACSCFGDRPHWAWCPSPCSPWPQVSASAFAAATSLDLSPICQSTDPSIDRTIETMMNDGCRIHTIGDRGGRDRLGKASHGAGRVCERVDGAWWKGLDRFIYAIPPLLPYPPTHHFQLQPSWSQHRPRCWRCRRPGRARRGR